MKKLILFLSLLACMVQAQTPVNRNAVSQIWRPRVVPTFTNIQKTWASFYNVVDNPATGTNSVVLSAAPFITSLTVVGSGSTAATTAFLVKNSANKVIFQGLNDGSIFSHGVGTSTTNLFYGRGSGIANLIGIENTVLGIGSAPSQTIGNANTHVGGYTARGFTGGSNNCTLGSDAISQNLTGSDNISIGVQSQASALGNRNIGIGTRALYLLGLGNDNLQLGYNSFPTFTLGTGNTLIGSSCIALSQASFNTIIGSLITAPSVTLANNIILADGQGNIRYRHNGTSNGLAGRVYIGSTTTAPTAGLHLIAGSTGLQPLRLTSGALATGTNIIPGGIEFLTDKFYFTTTTGPAQFEATMNEFPLGLFQIPVSNGSGRLVGSSALIFSSGDALYTNGNVNCTAVGKGLGVAEGAGARSGTVTLVAGTATVVNTSIGNGSRIQLTGEDDLAPANWGTLVYKKNNGVNFIIKSNNVADTRTITYLIVEAQ